MSQSRRMSAVEAIAGTAIGFAVAVLANVIILPLFGLTPNFGESTAIALVFTAISLLRGYLVRRLFNLVEERLGHHHPHRSTGSEGIDWEP